MKLGKRPARRGAVQFKLADVLKTQALPPRPKTFGHQGLIKTWGMLGNDTVGDCVLAGGAHETMLTNKGAGRTVSFTKAKVLSDYSAITGYDPKDPASDQGTDMQAAASYRRKTGLIDSKGKRHQIKAYLEPAKSDVEQILDAAYFLGAGGIGFLFPKYAMDQFNRGEPWHVVEHQPAPDGGHYVPVVGNDGTYLLVVTWGKLQRMTVEFFQKFNDESIAYVMPELVGSNGLTPEGFSQGQFDAMLAQMAKAA